VNRRNLSSHVISDFSCVISALVARRRGSSRIALLPFGGCTAVAQGFLRVSLLTVMTLLNWTC